MSLLVLVIKCVYYVTVFSMPFCHCWPNPLPPPCFGHTSPIHLISCACWVAGLQRCVTPLGACGMFTDLVAGDEEDEDDDQNADTTAPSLPYHYPRRCPHCPRVLSHSGNWKKHVATIHGNQERTVPCRICEGRFRTPEYLQKHLVRVHKLPGSRGRKSSRH